MSPEYESIVTMTNEEAANIILNLMMNAPRVRANGKSRTQLRIDIALFKAIDALRTRGVAE